VYFTELFVYGTLVDPDKRRALLGRALDYVVPDSVNGYEMEDVTIDGVEYPALVMSTMSHRVDGYVTVINKEELSILDEYETSAYARTMIRLNSGKKAWVYMKKELDNTIDLDLISEFIGDPRKLLAMAKEGWKWKTGFQCDDERDLLGNITYTLLVDGWSGHDEIIEALKRNKVFWEKCWYSTNRHGEYVFKVPVGPDLRGTETDM